MMRDRRSSQGNYRTPKPAHVGADPLVRPVERSSTSFRPRRLPGLDIPHLPPSMHIHQRELRSPATLARLHRNQVLVLLTPNFQFSNRPRIVFALQLFIRPLIVLNRYIPAMLVRMALQNFPVLLQLVAIERDNPRGIVIGNIVGDYHLHAKSFSP